jgi:pyroglutamyl-peptidase
MPLSILVTGFEPFGGATYNPSGEAALALDTHPVRITTGSGPRSGTIHGVRLPVLWERSGALILHELDAHPHIVVALGEGDTHYRVEQLADDVRGPYLDNAGHPSANPHATRTQSFPTTLPRAEIEAAISRASGGNVATSSDAGGFICNQVFYELMRTLQSPAARGRTMRAGFIHVPNNTVVPSSISQASVNAVVTLALEVTLRSLTDAEYARTQP